MAQHAHLDPSSFLLEGGSAGILLLHGFTGAPPEMRRLGDFLHEQGWTVLAPLLPGHGTSVEDMNRCRWTDWTAHVERALRQLQDRCDVVFVGGLSMGSLLASYLCASHPEIPAVALYAPPLKVANPLLPLSALAKYFLSALPKPSTTDLVDPEANKLLWYYDKNPLAAAHELVKLIAEVRRLLPSVQTPLLIFQATGDQTVHPQSAQLTYDLAGSPRKRLVTLHQSGHCLTIDHEWQDVARQTHQFFQKHDPS